MDCMLAQDAEMALGDLLIADAADFPGRRPVAS
jgi:hypothetical protein